MATKRILVVDDERTLNIAGADHVRTVDEAKAYLREHPVLDELWLDHDLGDAEDIMTLVHHIEHMWHWDMGYDIGLVVVHTMNPVGSQNILRALQQYYPTRRVAVSSYLADNNAQVV